MQKIITLEKKIKIIASASAVGHEEFFGPLGDLFDFHDDSDRFGAKTWEQAEGEMERIALNLALKKASLRPSDIDVVFAGDLQNQCVASSTGLSSFSIPYIGLYGACSTSAEAILCASLFLSASRDIKRCVAITSSHNCAAERQFRTPIEYGGQRTPTAQWTATASGAFILEREDLPKNDSFSEKSGDFVTDCRSEQIGKISEKNGISVTKEERGIEKELDAVISEVMVGKILDSGIFDASNMGAAMAPACASSIESYFKITKNDPRDFDLIVTGDLGKEGSSILYELLSGVGIDIKEKHIDCGSIMYDEKTQDCHSGGSGCGCSASILASHFIPDVRRGKIKNMLFLATGALMSPSSIQQGSSIAGIAPLVRIEAR